MSWNGEDYFRGPVVMERQKVEVAQVMDLVMVLVLVLVMVMFFYLELTSDEKVGLGGGSCDVVGIRQNHGQDHSHGLCHKVLLFRVT
jgi:hypothetical protein